MSHELKIFCFVLILCLPEINLSYAGHDGGHSTKSSRPTFTRSSGSGPFQMTKGSTASTSSSTSRNRYSGFLWDQYDGIQEQVAQGEGEYLEVIARFNGCPVDFLGVFKTELNQNYELLFEKPNDPDHLEQGITEVLQKTRHLQGVYNSKLLSEA
tara:strand:- start:248 stop:712 length:465 start_codon:yes stop_codon:yes gene_type:complete